VSRPVFLSLTIAVFLAACGPKAQAVSDAIRTAKRSHSEAVAAGAREHSEDLVVEAEDLMDQAESASRRGDARQAVFAAELAAQKLDAAKKQTLEAKPAGGPDGHEGVSGYQAR